MHWIPYAMVRITVVFVAGIILGKIDQEFLTDRHAVFLFLTCTGIYFPLRYIFNGSKALIFIAGLNGLGVIFLAGYLNVKLKTESTQPRHLLQIKEKIVAYTVQLTGYTEEKERSLKRTGEVLYILTGEGWRAASGKINMYWPETEPVAGLDYGDMLVIHGSPRVLDPPFNPYEFDYRRYLGLKNIYHQHYVKSGEWKVVQASPYHGIQFYACRARNRAVKTIRTYVSSPEECAIVMALVLGVTDGIDNELRNAYAASGVMHVLAVSGLHVSVIYAMLLFIFRPLKKHVTGPWVTAIVSIIILWAYACITGLSPSVLRAVTMFSFVAIARPINRSTNIYNTLAASAFCLLVFDPNLILSVGFQLSYAAVLGIVYLQHPLGNLWKTRSPILHYVWQMTCVSLAAQAATVPLTLLYFHQFPVYFLPANLWVIPGSCIVLVGGILLLFISPLVSMAAVLGAGLELLVHVLNRGVFMIEHWPLSLINNIYVTPIQCALMAAFILAFTGLVQSRKFKFLWMMATCVITFSLLSWRHRLTVVDIPAWIVYRIPGTSAIEWMKGGRSFFITGSGTDGDRGFHVQPNRLVHKIEDTEMAVPCNSQNGIQTCYWEGKSFLRIYAPKFCLPLHLTVDYLIICNNSLASIQQVVKHVNFRQLILDSSNSYPYCDRLESEAQAIGKPVFSVLKNGAFNQEL